MKDDVKVVNELHGVSILGHITPFTCHLHILFDVSILSINLLSVTKSFVLQADYQKMHKITLARKALDLGVVQL